MTASRRERFVTISGKDGYFPLLPEEKDAISIAIYFSATNVGQSNYYAYDWYKERTLYGRMHIARGEYTLKEHLIQYQNECVYEETATLYETVKRLQCQRQEQYEVNRFVVEKLNNPGASLPFPLPLLFAGGAYDKIPPQPIEVPGLQIDGIYYSMLAGCAGKLVLQTWYDDDVCKDVNGNPLTKNNRGKPPDPQVDGKPPSGTQANVPPPDYAPGSDYNDPSPGDDVPTDEIKDPTLPQGSIGGLYNLKYRDAFTASGEVRAEPTITIAGKYGSLERHSINNGASVEFRIQTAIGVQGVPQPNYVVLGQSGVEPNGSTTITITILSITPQ